MNELITEDWLKSVGFKWHQFDRQPNKHWLLWIGGSVGDRITSFEDMGVELAPTMNRDSWFCWLRSDTAGRYHRFIHIRHIRTQDELIRIVEALTGRDWNPDNNLFGSMHSPENAERIRQDIGRLDHKVREMSSPWADVEKDDTMGRALPEHMEAHAKTSVLNPDTKGKTDAGS